MNTTDTYRLEALLALADAYPGGLRTAEVARRRGVPEPFLARLLAELARAGLVLTARGPAGGARLARLPAEIPLLSVLARPERPVAGGAGTRWLAARLREGEREILAGLDLARLLEAERAATPVADFEI